MQAAHLERGMVHLRLTVVVLFQRCRSPERWVVIILAQKIYSMMPANINLM